MDPYTAAHQAELSKSKEGKTKTDGKTGSDKKDDDDDETAAVKSFTCSLCNFSSPYTYFGRKPPSTKSRMVLLEDAYVIKNPFIDPRQAEKVTVSGKPIHPPLILGSHCAVCRIPDTTS